MPKQRDCVENLRMQEHDCMLDRMRAKFLHP
jgi:hypothetical protein